MYSHQKLTFTLGECIVTLGTLFAIVTGKVDLTWAFAINRLTVVTIGAIEIALAFTTIRIAVVAIGTRVTIGWLESFATFTATGFLLAMSRGIEEVTLTS